jgi:MFS family permease
MTITEDPQPTDVVRIPDSEGDGRLAGWPVIVGLALLLLLALGWELILHPAWTAPTRDPAWYTWRANVVLQSTPGLLAREWGPSGVFAGGYRVTSPLAGALLQRVAGIDQYSFSAFMMIGIPVLAGLALGAAGYRARRDPLLVLLSMIAAAALFLTTPYVGYLDNTLMIFLLCLTFPFIPAARTSWPARVALFLIGIAAAFTHPTTCVLFGLALMALFGWHVVSSRFRFGDALRSDAPMLWSIGGGMITGLALWFGIWGPAGNFNDAAVPPPYTKAFFLQRLSQWVLSLQPLVIAPFIVIAVASVALYVRRERKPAGAYEMTSIWWLFPLIGSFTFLLAGTTYQIAGKGSPVVPYYRFMNATAAIMPLTAIGATVAIRWFVRRSEGRAPSGWWLLAIVAFFGVLVPSVTALAPVMDATVVVPALVLALVGAAALWAVRSGGVPRVVGVGASLLLVVLLGFVLQDGLRHRWVTEGNQWADENVRVALASAHQVVAAAGERPNILIMNYSDANDDTQTNTAYGWAKTDTNIFRTGLPGTADVRSATYLGTLDNYLAGRVTTGASRGYNTIAKQYFDETQLRERQYPADPVVFLYGDFYKGNVDVPAALAQGTPIGPNIVVIQGDGLYQPTAEVVQRAQAAAAAEKASLDHHASPLGDPLHLLRVLAGLFFLIVLPGLVASSFFELEDWPSRIALIPGMSIVLTLLSGIAVLAIWRGPLTPLKAWVVVAGATGVGLVLRVAHEPLVERMTSFGGFFNKMFGSFANPAFAVLMGVQFLTQAGQGVVQGAIGKSIAFGGQKGFDVSNVPSADYLLKVVLALYVPYTLISPFIGVFIDRFARRRVVWWSNLITAAIVAVLAVAVLLPLGSQTTEGKVGATAGLVVALLAAQAVVRVILAVKSAAIPDVLSGKDLLQANGLSQAGGGLFQIIGIAFGTVIAGLLGAWIAVLVGAAVFVVAAFVSTRMQRVEAHPHETSFAHEASQVIRTISAGLKEVAARPVAALGLSAFQMLRYQFWGFGLFVFALYAKNLVQGDGANTLSLVLSGIGGLFGGVLCMVLAQKWKDRIPPIRLLLASMALLGAGTLVFGGLVSVPGFAAMLFVGFFSFFLGKISVDTITQQAMPDDFRGRAFALFDIAYNLGFIVPALILSFIWVEGSATRTRLILVVSGAIFLGLTALVSVWARRLGDAFVPLQEGASQDAPTRA